MNTVASDAPHLDPAIALVSFALAPGPGGPEADVSLEVARALAQHWRGPVTSFSAGHEPKIDGLLAHAFADARAQDVSLRDRLAMTLRDQAARSRWSLGRGLSRALYERSGYSLKYHAWELWAGSRLKHQLEQQPNTVVMSRALPLCSLSAAHRVLEHRTNPWIVNLNDPCPPGLRSGLYPLDQKTKRLQARTFERLLPRIDAFTFPSRRLFELHAEAYPQILERPVRIVPHLAPALPHATEQSDPGSAALRLGFAGTLRHDLPHAAVLEALAATAASDPVEIHAFVGRRSPALERLAETAGIEVTIQSGLAGSEIDQHLRAMDALLCIESEIDRPLLLTKLISYLRFGIPILGVCADNSTTSELLQRTAAGIAVTYNDAGQIKAGLQHLIELKTTAPDHPTATERTASPRFEPRTAVETLRALLQDLRHRRSGLQGDDWP